MARILDALRQAENTRVRPEPLSVARPYEPELDTITADEEVPFIEVGASDRSIEASPSVLATPTPPTPVHETVRLVARERPGSNFAGVSFAPLPAEAIRLRPAYERFAPEIVAFHQPNHAVSEQYRILLAAIEAQLPEGAARV